MRLLWFFIWMITLVGCRLNLLHKIGLGCFSASPLVTICRSSLRYFCLVCYLSTTNVWESMTCRNTIDCYHCCYWREWLSLNGYSLRQIAGIQVTWIKFRDKYIFGGCSFWWCMIQVAVPSPRHTTHSGGVSTSPLNGPLCSTSLSSDLLRVFTHNVFTTFLF